MEPSHMHLHESVIHTIITLDSSSVATVIYLRVHYTYLDDVHKSIQIHILVVVCKRIADHVHDYDQAFVKSNYDDVNLYHQEVLGIVSVAEDLYPYHC